MGISVYPSDYVVHNIVEARGKTPKNAILDGFALLGNAILEELR